MGCVHPLTGRVTTDWDGVAVNAELPKIGRHAIASMAELGVLDCSEQLLRDAVGGDQAAQRVVAGLIERVRGEFSDVFQFSGRSRAETAKAVHQFFSRGFTGVSEPSQESVARVLGHGKIVGDYLLDRYVELIVRNLRFFDDLVRLTFERGMERPICVVTQTTAATLKRQFEMKGTDGTLLWTPFSNFVQALGEYGDSTGYPYALCAGDYPSAVVEATDDVKRLAYEDAAPRLQRKPEELFTFEDTASGAKAAKKAGFNVIGIRAEGSKQDLSIADVVVEGSLECLYDHVDMFVDGTPEQILEMLRSRL